MHINAIVNWNPTQINVIDILTVHKSAVWKLTPLSFKAYWNVRKIQREYFTNLRGQTLLKHFAPICI